MKRKGSGHRRAVVAAGWAMAATLGASLARADEPVRHTSSEPLPPLPPPPPPPPPPEVTVSPEPTAPPPQRKRPAPPFEPSQRAAEIDVSDWPTDAPAPSGYHWAQRPRKGPLIGGACLFGATWALSTLVALENADADGRYVWLGVPIAGPVVYLAVAGSSASRGVGTAVLVGDSLAQATGAALFIFALASPAPYLARDDYSRVRVLPVPMVFGRGASGAGVVGTF